MDAAHGSAPHPKKGVTGERRATVPECTDEFGVPDR